MRIGLAGAGRIGALHASTLTALDDGTFMTGLAVQTSAIGGAS